MPFAAMPPGISLVPIVQIDVAYRAAAVSPAGRSIVDARDGSFVIVADPVPVPASLPAASLALGRNVHIDRALLVRQDRSVRP